MAGKAGLKAAVTAGLPEPSPPRTAEQVTQRQDGDVLEAKSTSARIKTVEDLLRHIEADLTRYEVAASEATKWEVASTDATGEVSVTELHRVFVRLKPKAGPSVQECVEAMIKAAKRELRRPATRKPPKREGLWQVLPIGDLHVAKYAWKRTTGDGDYDIDIAERRAKEAAGELLTIGDSYKPARRTIAFLGDIFHYDTPSGTTTSGTPLERDGRLQKMIEVGCETLIGVIEQSADSCLTDVIVVNGNHDETLSWAFQRILAERFRGDRRVEVSMEYTGRQYASHGKNLLGFCHGHRAKKKLPQIMALERPSEWSGSLCREWHTGHYHSQAAEWQRPIETLSGVIVRTCPSLSAADDWHSEHGFIGSRQAMETFLYRPEGGLVALHVSEPR
jgi:UDP-2,3-diacylglucosamine pyrophosphatase LpxH